MSSTLMLGSGTVGCFRMMYARIAVFEGTVPARHSSRQAAKVLQGYSGL